MAKGKKSVFFCQNCGHEEAKWLGQCPGCGEWNTFVEEKIGSGVTKGSTQGAKAVRELVREAKVIPLNDVTAEDDVRCATGIKELDRVLGGGIVPGSLVLVGGDPGIGKSTLLLQVCRILADKKKVLYISGEESQTQIKLRANRMGNFADGLFLLCETNLEIIRGILEKEFSRKKHEHGYFICWKFDDIYEIYGLPSEQIAIDRDTTCIVVDYYLRNLNSSV